MAKTQKVISTNTNITQADPSTAAFRRAVGPTLITEAGKVPDVYGSKWIGREATIVDENGKTVPDPRRGRFVRDESVPLTPETNAAMQRANERIAGLDITSTLQGSVDAYGKAGDIDIQGSAESDLAGASGGYDAAGDIDIRGSAESDLAGASGNYDDAGGIDIQGIGNVDWAAASGGYDDAGGIDIQGVGNADWEKASGFLGDAAAGKSGAAGQGQFDAATGMYVDSASTFSPYGSQAQSLYGQSASPTGISSASPYLQQAAGNFTQSADAYMNPYNRAVTDRIATLGARNLNENLLEGISDDFVKSGGYGSTRQRDLMGRAIRDTQDSILGKQAEVLQEGYGQAAQTYGADAGRQAQLAQTAGGLGVSQQQILGQAAAGMGNLGSTYSGLVGADANRRIAAGQGLQGIGQSNIQASQDDYGRMLQSGRSMTDVANARTNASSLDAANQRAIAAGRAALGTARTDAASQDAASQRGIGAGRAALGTARGNLAGTEADNLRGIAAGRTALGTARGNLAGMEADKQLSVGDAGQSLGRTVVDTNLGIANADRTLGMDQYGREVSAIDAERDSDNTQNTAIINQMGAAGGALTSGGQGSGTTTGYSTKTSPGGSTLGQAAGAVGTLIAGANMARGGPMRKGIGYASGGEVGNSFVGGGPYGSPSANSAPNTFVNNDPLTSFVNNNYRAPNTFVGGAPNTTPRPGDFNYDGRGNSFNLLAKGGKVKKNARHSYGRLPKRGMGMFRSP